MHGPSFSARGPLPPAVGWPLGMQTAVGVAFALCALGLVFVVLLRRKEPSSTIAWILTLFFLPLVGAVLFLLFGRDRVRWPARRKRQADAFVRETLAAARTDGSQPEIVAAAATAPLSELERQVFQVGTQLTAYRPSGANAVDVMSDGNEVYEAMGKAIDSARHHVHAEFYLIRNDATGAWFRERLAAAAQRGVTVRLLGDGYGCFALGPGWPRPLKRAGGRFSLFLPMRSVFLQPVNLRNHRKILVVDGSLAFSGGMNVGDEYRGKLASVGAWHDRHFRFQGPVARAFQLVFLQDWFYATGEEVDPVAYFPRSFDNDGDAIVEVVPSGPDTRTEAIHRIFFGAIATARDRVWITTPYFVPDQAMLVALEVAAMRGVDVRLVLPSRSNHKVTFHAGRSFYERLLEAGVKIHEFRPGMVHAKTMVVDGKLCLVGSANMDMRSFRLNFELHALIHDPETAAALEGCFRRDLEDSDLLSLAAWRARSLATRIAEGGARLVSPLL